ncbi:MAG TPA: NAD-dependent epimerase/dehydratase family protein [Longimicrobium sp.]|nr:NAD-dependent epimerase/dehydratase family protein [Longimicrobium sp.]
MKIFVIGGSGFIGREVCRAAVEAGHEVLALARSGAPRGDAPWIGATDWVVADVLDPGAWRERLAGCGAVIHCVGIIAESAAHDATFERINGDAAIVAAREAARAGVEAFVFLSASTKPPLIPSGYITAKRRAEEAILATAPRPVVFRPGFVYGPGRLVSYAAALGLWMGMLIPGVRGKATESRPLAVAVVARAAVRAAGDPGARGIVDVDGIERLGAG